METSVDVQSYQLAPCLEVVVAAEKGGSTARGRVPREDTAVWLSRGIPCSSLVSPWVRAAPGTGYVSFSMAGPDTPTRQQPVGTLAMALTDGFHCGHMAGLELVFISFEGRRSHGRGVTEWLSRLSWTQTVVPNKLLLRFPLRLWRLQPKGQEVVEKELQVVCQQCRVDPGWERDRI